MNFLAHAAVARRHDARPAYLLGAVLPDLLPMSGIPAVDHRLDRSSVDPQVAAGWRDHHRVDAAFHALPRFLLGVQSLRTDLRRTRLTTGPRRAVAHVGWELLLDEAVAGDPATITDFRAALAYGADLVTDARWAVLLARLGTIEARSPADAATVAWYAHRAVGRRPRLAFDAEAIAEVAEVLDRHREDVLRAAPALLEELADRLSR
jgi:hypothetical protein